MSNPFVTNKSGNCRLCQNPDDTEAYMVACCECDRWFHPSCAKIKKKPTPEERFLCIKCSVIDKELLRLNQAASATANNPTEAFFERIIHNQQRTMNDMTQALSRIGMKNEGGEEEDWTIYLKRQALMRLPKFGGSAKEWPNFKRAFEQTSQEGAFNNLENLNRLQQVLYGAAAKSVQQLMMDPENVPDIMLRLEEHFGRSDQIYKEL